MYWGSQQKSKALVAEMNFRATSMGPTFTRRGGGGCMTCGWTGIGRPTFRKVSSSNYGNLVSYPVL